MKNNDRRDFLKKSLTIPLAYALPSLLATSCSEHQIMTVTGAIPMSELGVALTHEHIFSNFGAEPSASPIYDEEMLLAQVLPYLKKIKAFGCHSIFDCTGAYFGRKPELLKELSLASGLQLITNTGYYGAANDKYVPKNAYSETPEKIASHWASEWENGIGNSGIRPGFVKLAVDKGKLSDIDAKLVEAGAICHLQTGLTLAVHTGNNPESAKTQLAILKKHGVSPTAWVWVHANKVEQVEALITVAQKGAWISLDGLKNSPVVSEDMNRKSPISQHIDFLKEFKKKELLDRVLLSHDGNSYPRGKAIRPYDALFEQMTPQMKQAGFTEKEISLITNENPAKAFAVWIRKD